MLDTNRTSIVLQPKFGGGRASGEGSDFLSALSPRPGGWVWGVSTYTIGLVAAAIVLLNRRLPFTPDRNAKPQLTMGM